MIEQEHSIVTVKYKKKVPVLIQESRIPLVERVGKYRDFTFYVVAYDGWRCGYVQIPKYNPFYGYNYSGYTTFIFSHDKGHRFRTLRNKSIEEIIDVHGGVTFTGEFRDTKRGELGWLMGFDCHHAYDALDPKIMNKAEYDAYPAFLRDEGSIKTATYVSQECKNMIDQIILYSKIIKRNAKNIRKIKENL